MSGKYGNQLPAIAFANLVAATDLLTVYDASAAGTSGDDYDKTVALVDFFNRMLNGASISWMPTAFSAMSDFATGDRFLVWDASASAWKPVTHSLITSRLLSTSDASWLSTLALADVAALDHVLFWDNSASTYKAVDAMSLLARMSAASTTDVTSTPSTVTSAMSGTRLTNRGAIQVIEFDLPALTAGMRFTFNRIANYAVRIDPNGSELIGEGGAGKYLEIQSRGQVVIECLVNGAAEVTSASAMYGFEP